MKEKEKMVQPLKLAEETAKIVREKLAPLKGEERAVVVWHAQKYLRYMEETQSVPLVLRLKFYEVILPLYNFLRVNKQLGRREGRFDDEVSDYITNVLSNSLVNDDA